MLDMKKYIKEGRVEREQIAMDIKYRTITKDDLDTLVSNKEIRGAFIGKSFSNKKPKSEWNREYLDELSYAVVAEGFNAEYLYYLNEVAEYVSSKKNNKKIIVGAVIAGVTVAVLLIIKLLDMF